MSNKRVSELNSLTHFTLAASDLFLVADVSAIESKKITADELEQYILSGGELTGSLQGTSSYALRALSASYAAVTSASYATTSSWSNLALLANSSTSSSYSTYAVNTLSASYTLSSSYALTSSVQYMVTSSKALVSDTASYLLFTAGRDNGTSFNSISASLAELARTASFVKYSSKSGTIQYSITASFANTASLARTASFLAYSATNGSASYAVSSSRAQWASYLKKMMLWGLYDSSINSVSESRIETMSFSPSSGISSQTIITAYGTYSLPYTSSATGSLALAVRNQDTMIDYPLDSTPISFSAGGTVAITGSVMQPFMMSGYELLTNGKYLVFLSASGVVLNTNRGVTFRVETDSDLVSTGV